MALNAAITTSTTTSPKTAGFGCIMFDAISSTPGAGLKARHRPVWDLVQKPSGYTLTATDPRPGAKLGHTVSMIDGEHAGWTFAVPPDLPGDYQARLRLYDEDKVVSTALSSVVTVAAFAGTTLYLDGNATGAGDGSSWDDAFTDTATAITALNTAASPARLMVRGSQIYIPTSEPTIDTSNKAIIAEDGAKFDLETSGLFSIRDTENFTLRGVKCFASNLSEAPASVCPMFFESFNHDFCIRESGVTEDGVAGNLANLVVTSGTQTSPPRVLLLNNDTSPGCRRYSGLFGFADGLVCSMGGRYGPSRSGDGERPFRPVRTLGMTNSFDFATTAYKDVIRYQGCTNNYINACYFVVEPGVGAANCVRYIHEDSVGVERTSQVNTIERSNLLNKSGSMCVDRGNALPLVGDEEIIVRSSVCITTDESASQGAVNAHETVCSLVAAAEFGAYTATVGQQTDPTAGNQSANLLKYTGPEVSSVFQDRVWNPSASGPTLNDNTVDIGNNLGANPLRLDGSPTTIAGINAAANSNGQNLQKSFTWDANYFPSVSGTATAPKGVFVDYYGNEITPGTTILRGAVQEVPTFAPTVTTPTSASITDTTAALGGNITNDGGDTITERSIVIAPTATNADPEIGGTGVTKVVASGTATGVFTTAVTGLTASTGYSFKAYATNSTGTGYSDVATFTTSSLATLSITDTDGNPLDDPEVINATQSGTPGTWSVRINAADADWDTSLDGVVVGISSIGSVVNSTESDGTTPFTIGTGTVSAGDYIIVNGEFNYSTAGTFNPVRLTIEGGDGAANDVTQDWNITVAPSPGFLKTGVRSVRSVRSVRGVR